MFISGDATLKACFASPEMVNSNPSNRACDVGINIAGHRPCESVSVSVDGLGLPHHDKGASESHR
jgi:hypothetical protein